MESVISEQDRRCKEQQYHPPVLHTPLHLFLPNSKNPEVGMSDRKLSSITNAPGVKVFSFSLRKLNQLPWITMRERGVD